MFLSALYIDDIFLFEKPQIINFGGKYFYHLDKGTKISRKPNQKFIENFYADDTIQLVSAIVGKNGSGKTTILKSIIESIREENTYFSHIRIYEDDEKTYVKYYVSKIDLNFKTAEYFDFDAQTVYYSPFLDFHERVRGIDLSYDAILENDLEDIYNITQEGIKVIPSRKLKIKNWFRQIEFQNSQFGKELRDFFDFPSNGQSRISFNTHKIELDEKSRIQFNSGSNTPGNFQPLLLTIYDKLENEKQNIRENSKFDLVKKQKELFKLNILKNIIFLLIRQMEKHNTFLEEGFLKDGVDSFNDKIAVKNSLESFYTFLEQHYYKMSPGGGKSQILPFNITKKLIDQLYKMIDNLEAKDNRDTSFFNWSERAFYLDEENTKKVLDLHNDFLIEVDQYYGHIKNREGKDYFEGNRIEELINFEPSSRKLSSGENALLNFYSRVYNYFKKNLFELPYFKELPTFYFILLDEADLGFHPRWKKQFVKSCLSFLRSFFKKLEVNIQIIFTTHDPLTLSDIPNYNIVYLTEENDKRLILNEHNKPQKSFGANITDLLADSFFVGDGLIGNFAKDKIQETIDWLKKPDRIVARKDYHKKMINIVDEPLLRYKLNEMFYSQFPKDLDHEKVKKQIIDLAKRSGLDVNFGRK